MYADYHKDMQEASIVVIRMCNMYNETLQK